MNELQKAQLAAAIRWIIALAMASLAKDGFDHSTLTGLNAMLNPESIAGAIGTLAPLVWSMIHKQKTNTALVVAAATGTTTAQPTVQSAAALDKVVDKTANSPQIKPV